MRIIFLVSVPVSATEFLKPLGFPKWWDDNGVFCYVNKVIFGKHLRMGAGSQWSQPWDQRLELSVPPPWPQGREEPLKIDLNRQWPMSYSVMPVYRSLHKPPRTGFRERPSWWAHGDLGRVGSVLSPHTSSCTCLLSGCCWVLSFYDTLVNIVNRIFLWVLWVTWAN